MFPKFLILFLVCTALSGTAQALEREVSDEYKKADQILKKSHSGRFPSIRRGTYNEARFIPADEIEKLERELPNALSCKYETINSAGVFGLLQKINPEAFQIIKNLEDENLIETIVARSRIQGFQWLCAQAVIYIYVRGGIYLRIQAPL